MIKPRETYDPNIDAYRCWQLAIAEIRKRGLREGRYQPRNDEEREIAKGRI